ncbi:hypothetical protein [Vibrio hyugaensis]|uniref:hypothetical protein n=1 Tax=Vibrio hyugaensis TaxID=1534743 RepID=UPI0005ED4AA4|nr:hypothetical protein [Vibrio hyugaensis]
MDKKRRIAKFDNLMNQQSPASCPVSAWELLTRVLANVESNHAPVDEEKMTILPLDHKDVSKLENGGFSIPLIGYKILLNPNGAIRIINYYNRMLPSVDLPGADGKGFDEE